MKTILMTNISNQQHNMNGSIHYHYGPESAGQHMSYRKQYDVYIESGMYTGNIHPF